VLSYFWATVTSSPYATGPLSCLSVTLVYCGKTVGWIKMPLGTEVGLVPGDIVLDGNQRPHGKGNSSPPLFGPCLFRTMSVGAKRSPISVRWSTVWSTISSDNSSRYKASSTTRLIRDTVGTHHVAQSRCTPTSAIYFWKSVARVLSLS